jgi:hypothetical protein
LLRQSAKQPRREDYQISDQRLRLGQFIHADGLDRQLAAAASLPFAAQQSHALGKFVVAGNDDR